MVRTLPFRGNNVSSILTENNLNCNANLMELVDMLDLGSNGFACAGSSPAVSSKI